MITIWSDYTCKYVFASRINIKTNWKVTCRTLSIKAFFSFVVVTSGIFSVRTEMNLKENIFCYYFRNINLARLFSNQLCLSRLNLRFLANLSIVRLLYVRRYIFLAIYTAEMVIKSVAKGFILNKYTYLRNPWNWLDFVVITSGYATIGMEVGNLAGLRTFRVLRALKTVSIMPGEFNCICMSYRYISCTWISIDFPTSHLRKWILSFYIHTHWCRATSTMRIDIPSDTHMRTCWKNLSVIL